MSSVGIFWFVPSNIASTSTLVFDMTDVEVLSRTGRTALHAVTHEEYWERLAALGKRELRRRGLPIAPAMAQFDEYPRGHVEYEHDTGRFTIHTDPKVSRPSFIGFVLAVFGVAGRTAVVRSGRYQSKCLTIPPPRDCL